MPGPAALIALAARLGIPKAAKKLAEKGFKYLQKLVTKVKKHESIIGPTAALGTGGTLKYMKSKKKKDKPKVDSDLAIKKK